jgi:hypothetical protein
VLEVEFDALRLALSGPRERAAGLKALKRLRRLRGLRLEGSGIRDAELAYVRGLDRLEWLDLESCKSITDAGLINLAGPHQLLDLHLAGLPIGDEGLVHLKALSRLERLNLTHTRVSDAGLTPLRDLLQLKELSFVGSRVTVGGASDLGKLLKTTSITGP